MTKRTAILGLSSVGLFGLTLVVFAAINREFDTLDDYVSKLGAVGQPYALWWNVVGFGMVGCLLTAFGWSYGRILGDRLVGGLLALFGVGFGVAAVPVDPGDGAAAISKAHTVAICLGAASWMFALARMAQVPAFGSVHRSAKVAATLLMLPILGLGARLWSIPMTHRLVFLVIFGWIVVSCASLLRVRGSLPSSSTDSRPSS